MLLILTLTLGALTIGTEYAFWLLFRRRLRGIHLPREADLSFFRFFTLTRLRIVAIMHALFLVVTVSAIYSFLW